jgi:hypothetical protein
MHIVLLLNLALLLAIGERVGDAELPCKCPTKNTFSFLTHPWFLPLGHLTFPTLWYSPQAPPR